MHIIGLVGPFGSGCSYIGDIISETKDYIKISLSDKLREEYKSKYNKEPERKELQDFGNELRSREGGDYLARQVSKDIKKSKKKNYIVDSIRNPAEVEFFRNTYTDFYLFGIFADRDVRWDRVKDIYSNNQTAFENDDSRDRGEKLEYGQRVTDTFIISDIVILNNITFKAHNKKREEFIDKVKKK